MMFGNGGDGLSRQVVEHSDRIVRILMVGGVDSLNVAAVSVVIRWATCPTCLCTGSRVLTMRN